jgi:hypothetical protein
MFRILAPIMILFATLSSAYGQEIIFSTRPPVRKMGVEDAIHVQYEIQNAQRVQNIVLQKSRDFKVLGSPSMSRNFSVMNDKVSQSVTYTYAFQPKRTGRLNFPIATATVKGRKIKSSVAIIDVVKGSLARRRNQRQQAVDPFAQDPFFQEMKRMEEELLAQQEQFFNRRIRPSPAPQRSPSRPAMRGEVTEKNLDDNVFIRATVDKKEAHVGEQLIVKYKLYVRAGIEAQMGLPKVPELDNFWSHDFDIPRYLQPKREILNGKIFKVFLIKKTALFPTKTGELTIKSIKGEGEAIINTPIPVQRRSPFSGIVENYISYRQKKINVNPPSNEIAITVSEFPEEEKPKIFSGAVGSFSLESKISAAEITTDDVAELTLTIRGNGNIKLIDQPKLLLPDSIIEMFDPVEFDTITSTAKDRITGFKQVKYRFSPKGTGVLKVPSISLAYYNAEAERYEIKKTPEYSIQVNPGKVKPGNQILPMYIHDIASENTKLTKEKTSILPEQMWYWGAYLLPTLGFLFFLGLRRKEENNQKDTVRFKNKRANKIALSRLNKAEQHRKANETVKFYEETSKAVWLYLSDKLNIPLSTLSKEMAGTLLRKKEVSQDVIDEVFLITEECELALYTPDGGDFKMNQIYSDSLRIIGTLEDQLG